MKIAFITIKDQEISKEELAIAFSAVLEPLHASLLIVDEDNFSNIEPCNKEKKDSPFITACKGIIKACGNPEERGIFRSNFWKAALVDKAIKKPILEVIAFGPKCHSDLLFVEKNNLDFLVEICSDALSALYGKDI